MTDTLLMYPMFEEGKANQDQLLLNTRDIRVRVNVFIIEVTRNQQHQLLCNSIVLLFTLGTYITRTEM